MWGSNGKMPLERNVGCLPGVFRYPNPQNRIHVTEKPSQLMRDVVQICEPVSYTHLMKRYEELYHDPQLFFLLGKTLCVEHTTPEGYTQFMQATRQPPRQEQER